MRHLLPINYHLILNIYNESDPQTGLPGPRHRRRANPDWRRRTNQVLEDADAERDIGVPHQRTEKAGGHGRGTGATAGREL